MQEIIGEAVDGTKFTAESAEVKEFMAKYPDVTLEAAIGSVINEYNNSIDKVEEPEGEEVVE